MRIDRWAEASLLGLVGSEELGLHPGQWRALGGLWSRKGHSRFLLTKIRLAA